MPSLLFKRCRKIPHNFKSAINIHRAFSFIVISSCIMASLWISEQYAIPDDSSSSNQSAAEPTTPANFQSEPTEDPVRVSTDSGFVDDDSMLSTTTIDSETKADEQENGRTYHGYKSEKKFVLPNDERERERLNSESYPIRMFVPFC